MIYLLKSDGNTVESKGKRYIGVFMEVLSSNKK